MTQTEEIELLLKPYNKYLREELNNITGIYCFKNKINNKVYIGQSNDIGKRVREHYRDINDSYYFHRALKKYGIDNFDIYLLETYSYIDKKLQDFSEKYFIKKFKANNSDFGYNLTEGGSGNVGVSPSQETRDLLAEINSIPYIAYNYITKKYIEATSNRDLVNKLKDLGYKDISESKIRCAANGSSTYTSDFLIAHTLEELQKKISTFTIPKTYNIFLYNFKKQDGIKEFNSTGDAENYIRSQGYEICQGHVRAALERNSKYIKDFLIASTESELIDKINKYSPYIYFYNIEHRYILTFENAAKASRILKSLGFKVSDSTIGKCKSGSQQQTGGFIIGKNKEELLNRICNYTKEEITSVIKLIKEYNLENSQETLNWADSLNQASIEF